MYIESKIKTNKLNEETNKLVPCTEKLLSVTKMLFGTRNRCYFSLLTKKKTYTKTNSHKIEWSSSSTYATRPFSKDIKSQLFAHACRHYRLKSVQLSSTVHTQRTFLSFVLLCFVSLVRSSIRESLPFVVSFFCRSYAHRMIKNFSQWNYCFAC